MLRLLVLVVLCGVVRSDDFEDFILDLFGPEANENHLNPTCGGLEGRIQGCNECYQCQDNVIGDFRNRGRPVFQYELKNSSCMSRQVCCITQLDLLTIRSNEDCGKNNPFGQPRRRRQSLRSVLQGEYPWRAWVYRKGSHNPLCAATFVNEVGKALITLASCVKNLAADQLEVTFVKGAYRSAVKRVILYDEYDHVSGKNNIAILTLHSFSNTPKWIKPACLPVTKPLHGLPCITTSDDENFINTIIPLKSNCTESDTVCAIAPRGDYIPEKGAGLYCKEQSVTVSAYIVYGLAIEERDVFTTYTDVASFSKWVDNVLMIS